MNINLKSNHGFINTHTSTKSTKGKTAGGSLKAVLDQHREALRVSRADDEESEKRKAEKIGQKLNAGKKLSTSEMDFLRRTNPELYMKALRIQMKREMVESSLKNCKSKQEVEEAAGLQLGMINDMDPDREAMINAVNDVVKEFKKTDKYKSLPQESEEKRGEGYGSLTSEEYNNRGALRKEDAADFDVKL
ncbi:hypothetical protein R2R35_24315 [Anaerocolumna sp. AGMB13020]|uniref:hypothetical protein n=1 Tax=Anaerocolumna sp. AGMB13020 TaxID=3081750 RepID=UPI00295485B1|nr:hypothetical protein [Anaerocolumna sp. AGMB13020]WOO36877.1 hypothetical protein R2R35_24315 [Anaerocolumna sp. AGMB13020]